MVHVRHCALHALQTLPEQNMLAEAGFHVLTDSAMIRQMHLMTLKYTQEEHTLQQRCKTGNGLQQAMLVYQLSAASPARFLGPLVRQGHTRCLFDFAEPCV